jgi:predicted nucleic acid-binding protein
MNEITKPRRRSVGALRKPAHVLITDAERREMYAAAERADYSFSTWARVVLLSAARSA